MIGINKNFCELNPVCYAISEKKEICKRHIKNFLSDEKFTNRKRNRSCATGK